MAAPTRYIDTIQDYFNGLVPELDFEHDEYLQHLQEVHGMMVASRSTKYIHKVMREIHGLSRNQIYARIKDAKTLIADMHKVDRDMARHIAMENAQYAMRLARKDKNSKDLAAAVNTYIKAAGLHLDQSEMPDMEKILPPAVITAFPAEALEMMQLMLSQGAVNLNTIPTQPEPVTLEIPHEEVGEDG